MELSLIPGIKTAKKNEIPIELTIAPKQVNGNTMVPLRFVSEAFGAEVIWNEDSQVISIDTTPKSEIEIQETQLIEYPVLSINEEGDKITYNEAIEKALNNNLALQNIKESIKISEELQENASNTVTVQRPSSEDYTNPAAMFVAEATHINNLLALTQANYGLKATKYQKQIQEGIIKYQVKNSFDSILSLKKISKWNKSLEASKMQLDILIQKANLGLESDFNKTKAEQDFENRKSNLNP